jgi:hypothetical protein
MRNDFYFKVLSRQFRPFHMIYLNLRRSPPPTTSGGPVETNTKGNHLTTSGGPVEAAGESKDFFKYEVTAEWVLGKRIWGLLGSGQMI